MILRIYDYFSRHIAVLWSSLIVVTVLLACLVFGLSYKEDITDFLPIGTSDREALSVYQDIAGANRMFIMFRNPQTNDGKEDGADKVIEAIDCFSNTLEQSDSLGWCNDLTTTFDMDKVSEVIDFVYGNIPYFLTDKDYNRMDSLLASPEFIHNQLNADREMLMFPSGGFVADNISRDPLGLFAPVAQSIHGANSQMKFEMYDGYIFTPDMSRAIVMMTSPFGNSETEQNGRLLHLLETALDTVAVSFPDIEAHIVGGPEIAVGNASQIKSDSILAVTLSGVFIILFLFYSFRSLRNILLILLSIGWGWLFAIGGISLFHDEVSIIVIGISSVILGIAVNYPLHLIAHTNHEPNMRKALREVFAPLVVGNITTVGAFLALVPLQSTALCDLGLFASLLLVGTIAFVLIYLPHFTEKAVMREHQSNVLEALSHIKLEDSRLFVTAVVIITIILGWFSLGTEFDSNMANINYMTAEQREEMSYFQNLLTSDTTASTQTVYVVSSGENFDEALALSGSKQDIIDSLMNVGLVTSHSGITHFVSCKAEQKARLERWHRFVNEHSVDFGELLAHEAEANGFSGDAFEDFRLLIENTKDMQPQECEYFAPLTAQIFSSNISADKATGRYSIVDVINVKADCVDNVKSHLAGCFDVESMNGALADNLSDNFNYIGWACSIIVFIFLWFSFGRIELAMLSFLPMAVSWVWILGIMTLCGIKFNIVNVILATFIFGQGDDYTIFMTEGCQYEYAHRRPMLATYKSSILQSAVIMFLGIGTLIVAKHPALSSLAEITIIGMFCVVLMAYLIPPLLFKWLVMKDGQYRKHPLTLMSMLGLRHRKEDGSMDYYTSLVRDRYLYKGREITTAVNRSLGNRDMYSWIQAETPSKVVVIRNAGYGELALLYALSHPDVEVMAIEADDEKLEIGRISAMDIVENLTFQTSVSETSDATIYDLKK